MSTKIEAEQVFECIGKGGEYTVVATAVGAGTMKEHECLFVYRNAEGIHFVRAHDDFWDRMQEAGKFAHAGEKLHPIQQCLRDNGDLIAAQATIAQQAQMIEHLRGGPTPGFTSVDMTTAAADGFRDGEASVVVENKALRKDAERYRWLREQEAERGVCIINVGEWTAGATCIATTFHSAEFADEMVDAAMRKEG